MSLICSSVKYSLNFSKILDAFFSPPSSAENPQKYEFSKSCGVKSPENKILEYKVERLYHSVLIKFVSFYSFFKFFFL